MREWTLYLLSTCLVIHNEYNYPDHMVVLFFAQMNIKAFTKNFNFTNLVDNDKYLKGLQNYVSSKPTVGKLSPIEKNQ